jgi:hypothetical protein
LGAYRKGKLHYFGHSGSGFTEKGLKEAIDRLKPFFADEPSFRKSTQDTREDPMGPAGTGV